MSEEWEWNAGDNARADFTEKRNFEEGKNGTFIYNVDDGRMTNHYRYVVFPSAEEAKKCLGQGTSLSFIVEKVTSSSDPGDDKGAVPEGGFRHSYFHVKAGSVSSN